MAFSHCGEGGSVVRRELQRLGEESSKYQGKNTKEGGERQNRKNKSCIVLSKEGGQIQQTLQPSPGGLQGLHHGAGTL